MIEHYATHVEDTDDLISVAGPILEQSEWWENYKQLMDEQAKRKYGFYIPTSEGDFPSIPGTIARYSAKGLTNEQMSNNPVWKDLTGNGHDLQMKNFAWAENSGISSVYPDSIVFDGVDDYGVCDNFPILTKESGYTVVALRHILNDAFGSWISKRTVTPDTGAFIVDLHATNGGSYSQTFGKSNQISINKNNAFVYQTSGSYMGNSITKGEDPDNNKLVIGAGLFSLSLSNVTQFVNCSIHELVILDHDATEEELTKIKEYYMKQYPWLFFDQAWTVNGKTNDDEDRATIKNLTGNGNDLVLSNFAFAGNSGYGSYADDYNNWQMLSGYVDGTKSDHVIKVTQVINIAVQVRCILSSTQDGLQIPSNKVKITGLTEGQTINYRSSNNVSYLIEQDGIYTLPEIDLTASGWYGFQFNKIQESCDIIVEQIPEYEGYLVTDGVDDMVQSSSFVMNENWTVVGDWVILEDKATNAGIIKHNQVYIYNNLTGVRILVKQNTSSTIFGDKSIKAIQSDGTFYDSSWAKHKVDIGSNVDISKELNIGWNPGSYSQMAFKNLGIYDGKVLSKEDCIKAYNYLQTLKEK